MKVWSVLLMLCAAAYSPLMVWSSNPDGMPHPERLFLLVAGGLAVGVIGYVVARTLGASELSAGGGGMMMVLILMSGGNLTYSMSWVAVAGLAIATGALVAYGLNRLGTDSLRRIPLGGLAVFLIAGPLGNAVSIVTSNDVPYVVSEPATALPVRIVDRPDVFVVVLDGFVGDIALERFYGDRGTDLAGSRALDGVLAPRSVWAPYPFSLGSIAALLNMDYPTEADLHLTLPVRRALADLNSGHNRAVSFFNDAGYETYMVESGWSRSYCGEPIDVCVASAFLDEGTFAVLSQSFLRPRIVETRGSPFTTGAFYAMDWLTENGPAIAEDGRPSFVFAHVEAPHPPLFIDASCDFIYEEWREGASVYGGESSIERRKSAYLDQTTCMQSFENLLFPGLPEDAIVIVVSDHGPDSLHQLSLAPQDWDMDDQVERLNAHLSARLPEGCFLPDPIVATEVLWTVLWCLSDEPAPDPSPWRLFGGGLPPGKALFEVVELGDDQVVELMQLEPSGS